MLLISFGTRPEYIKLKPVIESIKGKIPYKLLFTGQHVDLLSEIDGDIQELEIENGNNRLDSIVQSVMNNEDIFTDISAVLVQGDTTSVFAVALAAFHRKIKIVHLEAGLRTWNKYHPYPEEFNRCAVSRMADIHLCPTANSASNLENERVNGKIHVVGNTVLDNLVGIPTLYDKHIIVTMHRRENHDNMDAWFKKINNLAKEYDEYEFIIPLHPNPNVQKHRHLLTNLTVVDSMEHASFIKKLASSHLVITDSGGIQEESSFFKKKCIVCREHTERGEGLEVFSFLVSEETMEGVFRDLIEDNIPSGDCPYGDGKSAERITKILIEELKF